MTWPRRRRCVGWLGVGVAACATVAAGPALAFDVVNHTGRAITDLRATPETAPDDGDNLIAGRIFASGLVAPVAPRDQGGCAYRIVAAFADGRRMSRRQDVCAQPAVIFTHHDWEQAEPQRPLGVVAPPPPPPPPPSSTSTSTSTSMTPPTSPAPPMAPPPPSSPRPGPQIIKDVQDALAGLGYGGGPADGVWTARWARALADFQTAQGLPATGVPDKVALDAIIEAMVRRAKDDSKLAVSSTGTGFVASPQGHLVTNHHVVAGCARILAVTMRKQAAIASVVAVDQSSDLAVLSASFDLPPPPLAFRPSPTILVGEDIVSFGYPLASAFIGVDGAQPALTRGGVAIDGGLEGDRNSFAFTAPISSGNSGGPILDDQGRVVGVAVSGSQNRSKDLVIQNMNFAVRHTVAMAMLRRLGVEPTTTTDRAPLHPATIGQRVGPSVVLLACFTDRAAPQKR